ncbi:hypothetical protein RhiirB3_394667 [Rhizophagus irregularis]|nr:hypothetical protein RhiirB3_394667 [Rhizophagus irregularis]
MDGTVTCRRLENIIENNKEAGSSIAKLLRAFSNKVKKDELHFQIAQQKWGISIGRLCVRDNDGCPKAGIQFTKTLDYSDVPELPIPYDILVGIMINTDVLACAIAPFIFE